MIHYVHKNQSSAGIPCIPKDFLNQKGVVLLIAADVIRTHDTSQSI